MSKKTITLQIEDQKFDTFRSFIETLDYVSVIDNDLPEWQKVEANKRLDHYKNNPDRVLDPDDVFEEIDKEF